MASLRGESWGGEAGRAPVAGRAEIVGKVGDSVRLGRGAAVAPKLIQWGGVSYGRYHRHPANPLPTLPRSTGGGKFRTQAAGGGDRSAGGGGVPGVCGDAAGVGLLRFG